MIAKIVLPVILAALIIGKRKFFRAIPISGYAYVMAWLLVGLTYGCLWISHYLLAFLGFNVHWENLISDNRWIIQIVLFALFVLYMLVDRTSSSSRSAKRTTTVSGVVAGGVAASTIKKRNNNTSNISVNTRNIQDLRNKVTAGVSIRIDWEHYSLSDIGTLIGLAKNSGATITIFNVKSTQNKATIDNMSIFAAKAPGLVKYETPLDANFDALQIAKSGACFVCDNSKGSSLITQIARAAKQSKGHVTFINCPKGSFAEMINLKQECSNHIDFS